MAFLLNGREYYSLSFGMASNWDLKSAEMDDDCAQVFILFFFLEESLLSGAHRASHTALAPFNN